MDRLSGYDNFFLELESTTQPLNVCSLLELKTTTMPGGYSFDRFADALAGRVSALPDLRLKLADSQLNLANPVWVEDEDFRLDRHLHRVGLPRPGGRYELAEICGHLAALPLDRDHPLWEMWLIEPADDADALAVMLKSHHAALDGVAGADLMLQLCSLVPDAPKPDRVDGPGTPNLVAIAVSGLVDFVRRPLRLVTLVPDTVTTIAQTVARARSGRAMARPFAAPVTAFNAPFTARRNVAFTQLELATSRPSRIDSASRSTMSSPRCARGPCADSCLTAMSCRRCRWSRPCRCRSGTNPIVPAAIRRCGCSAGWRPISPTRPHD